MVWINQDWVPTELGLVYIQIQAITNPRWSLNPLSMKRCIQNTIYKHTSFKSLPICNGKINNWDAVNS